MARAARIVAAMRLHSPIGAATARGILALAHGWLLIDFFGESRRSGEAGSTLTTTIFSQSTIGLVFAALLFPDYPLVPFAAANLSLSTMLVAIGWLGQTPRRDRARADDVLLRTAPLPRSALVAARALHGSFYVALITIGLALPPAILCYWVAGERLSVVGLYLAVACCLSGIATGALALLSTALVRWLGPARGLLAHGSLRAILIGAGFVLFAICLRHLHGSARDLPLPVGLVAAWPPYHGARLLADPAHGLRWAALLLAWLPALLLLGALLERAERRPARRRGGGPGALGRLERALARGGPLLGMVAFISAMLQRSAGFRAKVLPIFGLPAAMIVLAFLDPDPGSARLLLGVTLQFPAIYLPLLVAFVAQAERPRAAWVFHSSPSCDEALGRRAALLSLSARVLLPVHAAALVVMLAAGTGALASASLALFSLAAAILTARVAVRQLERLPFTDAREGVRIDLGGLLGTALLLAAAGGAFGIVAGSAAGAAVALTLTAAAAVCLHRAGGGAP